jgi:hypothetical protein
VVLAVRWLGTTLDGQTDCFKIDRICLSVVNPLSARLLGTTLDGQTDCFKIDRLCLSVVNPSSVRWLGTTLDGQTDCFKIDTLEAKNKSENIFGPILLCHRPGHQATMTATFSPCI